MARRDGNSIRAFVGGALIILLGGCGKVLENKHTPKAERTMQVDPGGSEQSFRELTNDFTGQTIRLVSFTARPPDKILRDYHELTQATVVAQHFSDYTELRSAMADGKFDVALAPDELLALLVTRGHLLPLSEAKIPILKHFRSHPGAIGLRDFPKIDPKFKYSVPYFIGRSGVAYDSSLFANMYRYTWKDFLNFGETFQRLDDVLDRRVDLAVDHRIAMGLSLLAGEADVNSENPEEISAAAQRLLDVSHLIGNVDPGRFIQRLGTNDAIIGICWEDHARQAAHSNPKVQFVIPGDGSIAYLDSLVISRHVRNPALAEHLVHYLTDPEIAAKVSNHTLSRTAIPGTKPYLSANQISDVGFLPVGNNSKDYYLHSISEVSERSYQRFWRTFTNANAGILPAVSLDFHVGVVTNHLLGKPADIHLHLANTGREPLTDLEITVTAPEGTTLATTNNSTDRRSLTWNLESLPSRRIESFFARAISRRAGHAPVEILIQDGTGVSIARTLPLNWRGIPSFAFRLQGRRNPIVVGQTNEYLLNLSNDGEGPDRVAGFLEFPPQLQPITVHGTTEAVITNVGRYYLVVLGDVAELRPGEKAQWSISAIARTNGNAIIHAEARPSFVALDKLRSRTTTRVLRAN